MSVKEVTKALKNALYEDTSAGEDSPSPGFPTEPSEDLSNALQTFVASAEDTGLSKEDASKLHDALLEFASHVGSAPAKRCLGLQSLAQLLNVDNAKWLPRPPLQLLQSLWSSLLRPCLAPALEKTAKRDPLRKSEAEAVKRITLWALEPNEEEAVQDATLEAVVLNDYCQLAQSAAYSALSADKSLLHLKDVLVASARSRPKAFLGQLAVMLPHQPKARPALLDITSHYLRQHSNLAHHVIGSGMLKELFTCFLADMDPIIIQYALSCILVILPRITVALPQFLPDLMACYAKVAALHHRQSSRSRSFANLEKLTTVGPLDGPPSPTAAGSVPSLNTTLEFVQHSTEPHQHDFSHLPARELFTLLYGLLPCNLSAFLRHPDQYLNEHEWQCPYSSGLEEPSLDLRLTANNSDVFLKTHALQTTLITSSPNQEIIDLKRRWERYDASGVIDECEKLCLIRSSDAARPQPKETFSPPAVPSNIIAEMTSPPTKSEELPMQSPAMPLAQLPDLEITNVQQTDANAKLEDGAVDSNVGRMIALKDREISLLRSQLQYEFYLKAQHVQHMGALHRQKVLDSGYEADRQALMNQVKYYRSQLTERQGQIEKQRSEATTARLAHVKWEGELRTKNRAIKDERRAWRAEGDALKSKMETMQAQLAAQSKEVDEIGAQNFDLKTELSKTSQKADKAASYEESLQKVTTSMLLWDQDIKKQRQQEQQIERVTSDWRKACDLAEASEAETTQIKRALEAMEDKASMLQHKLSEAERKLESATRPTFQPAQRLDSSEMLRKECAKMRARLNELEEANFELRASHERGREQQAHLNGHGT